jgi:hypothetical protein
MLDQAIRVEHHPGTDADHQVGTIHLLLIESLMPVPLGDVFKDIGV